ncbi:MAG TPA: S4 domain-containing protein, partial [Polyangiaceae bacterium]|nr:S4 domain-containing protein [Polyangiaceae bacterium]
MRRKAWIWGFERVFIPRRLDKFLRDATDDSTLKGRDSIRAGRVHVNGVVCRDATKLVFEEDVVTREGDPLAPRTSHVHIMLNKPLGVTSSVRDP